MLSYGPVKLSAIVDVVTIWTTIGNGMNSVVVVDDDVVDVVVAVTETSSKGVSNATDAKI